MSYFKKSILLGLAFGYTYGAEYIIPPEYDNLVNGQASKVEVLISNSSPYLSTNTYNLQGSLVKYRCVAVPKINCGNGYTPQPILSLKKAPVLKDSTHTEQITAYQIDVQVDADVHGNDFYVCGAGVGAITWDKSEFTKSGTTYTYSYVPENKQIRYFFFTDMTGNTPLIDGIGGDAITGSSDSYMVIDAEQICR